jgi:hypothetical protein
MKRLLVSVLAFAALALALYNTISPDRSGALGLGRQPGGALTPVAGGPAARAGIKRGDRIDYAELPLTLRIALSVPRAGQSFGIPVERSGARHIIAVRAEAAPLGFFSIGRYIDLALVILYVFFGFIVLLKAPRNTLSTLLVWMMMIWALVTVSADYGFTAPDNLSSYFVGSMLLGMLCTIFAVLIVKAIAALPVGMPTLRGRLARYAPALGIVNGGPLLLPAIAIVLPAVNSPIIYLSASIASFAYGLVATILTLALVQTAAPEQRARARWFVSSLVLCWFLAVSLLLINFAFIKNSTLFIALYYLLNFALVGTVYATLRHRLVDLDVVLSRSAVFGVVSLALLTAFVGAEWLGGKIADAVVGQGRWHGITTQLLSFTVAIGVGLYVRHLHSQVEARINALLFRDRMRKLRLLESFAHEADLIDSRSALLNVAFEALVESLDTADISIYISDGRSFACIRTSSSSAPERLDKTDRLILQLLHRREPSVSEVPTLQHWLIVPLAVRAEVIGFLACGVKRDHTVYLPEELRALSTIAQHMATSYALLTDSVPAQ